MEQRDWLNNATILSGDLGVPGDNTDNCYHVFFHPSGSNIDATAVLDGVTITGGNANTAGGNNCRFVGNEATTTYGSGGAMYNYYADPTIVNCEFSDNLAARTSRVIINCVFYDNTSGCIGDGIYNYQYSDPVITNSILMGQDGIYSSSSSEPIVTFCNVEQSGFDNPDDHNISEDPLFADPDLDDFHLLANSPCIDAGNNDALPADLADLDQDDDTAEPLPLDYFGNARRIDDTTVADTGQGTAPIVDMGIHEFGSPASTVPDAGGFSLGCYPNPFNPVVHITFSVPQDGLMSLMIYDCRGRVVNTLLSGQQSTGDYNVVWWGQDERGYDVPSGVYFCVLRGEGLADRRKMVLIR